MAQSVNTMRARHGLVEATPRRSTALRAGLLARAWAAPEGSTQQVQTYTLFAEQVQPMLNAYEQLRQSAYGALVMQTRLKPYLDAVEVVIGEGGCCCVE